MSATTELNKSLKNTHNGSLVHSSNAKIVSTDPFLPIIEQVSKASDGDIAKLEKLLEMKKNWDKEQARKSFLCAFSAFQEEMPPVQKLKSGHHGKYADICDLVSIAKPYLSKNGLSYRFQQTDSERRMTIECIISHVDGHSVSTSMESELVTASNGGMNNLQQRGATISYIRRYALSSALGIVTADEDSDGRLNAQDGDLINDEQLAELEVLIKPFSNQRDKFLKSLAIKEMRDLPLCRFAQAKRTLENRVKKNGDN